MKLSMPFNCNSIVDFDLQNENFTEDQNATGKIQGNCDFNECYKAALFLKDKELLFFLDGKIFQFESNNVLIKYHHVINEGSTVFSIKCDGEEYRIIYHSWWSDIPDFIPVEPEQDADEDYLAYIYQIWLDKEISTSLKQQWS